MAGIPRTGELFAGRYRIVREIGRGGMGVVYAVQDEDLGREVALKVLLPSLTDEEFRLRFQREASVLARIRSRHIVTIHDVGEEAGVSYLITEMIADGDLQSWISRRGPLPRSVVLPLVAEVCEALADAHGVGVVHRDVKPGNVLLWERPTGLVPYLCDFGIAVDGDSTLTRTGTLVGSPAYMAPERHFGHPADERGDVYSAGCLLWSAITGSAPYSGTDFQVAEAHINGPIPRLGTGGPVDDGIDELLRRCLSKEPEGRIQTAAELQQELERLAALSVSEPTTSGRNPGVTATRGPEPRVPPQDPLTIVKPTPESGRPTVLKQGPPPPPSIDPPADGGGAAVAESGGGGRRWALLSVAAVTLLVVVGLVVALIARDSADQSATAGGANPTSTVSPDPLPIPGVPRVNAEAGYRSVAFRLAAPKAGVVPAVVEWRDGSRWRSAPSRLRQPTKAGGERACVRVRTVASEGSRTAHSKVVRACGQSDERVVRLTRKDDRCQRTVSGVTYDCQYYQVSVAGFASGTRPYAVIRPADGASWCDDPAYKSRFCERLRIDRDGRGVIPKYFAIVADSGLAVLDVDGVRTKPIRLYCPRCGR